MFFSKIDKSKIHKILVITLSNIGDVIVSFLVLDVLKGEFPQAELSVVVGPKGETLLKDNPQFHKIFIFDKHQSVARTLRLLRDLRREHFDLVVDLRNTAIPFLIGARYCTSPWMRNSPSVHMRLRHLQRLRAVVDFQRDIYNKTALYISPQDQEYVARLVEHEIGEGQKFFVICPSAADHRKRWRAEGFAELADQLMEKYPVKIVLAGEGEGKKVAEQILQKMRRPAVNLSGKTTLRQLAELLRRSSLAIVNDSGPMHLASYLDIPVVTIFGPTDPTTAAPWSRRSYFIKKDVDCPACRSRLPGEEHECMKAITSKEIFEAIQMTDEGVVFSYH